MTIENDLILSSNIDLTKDRQDHRVQLKCELREWENNLIITSQDVDNHTHEK